MFKSNDSGVGMSGIKLMGLGGMSYLQLLAILFETRLKNGRVESYAFDSPTAT